MFETKTVICTYLDVGELNTFIQYRLTKIIEIKNKVTDPITIIQTGGLTIVFTLTHMSIAFKNRTPFTISIKDMINIGSANKTKPRMKHTPMSIDEIGFPI